MAERALPPGAVRRRRTAFGLFDADGWTWASIKAAFWFFFIIFVLGYLPDRAYYFTVSPTIDVGYNVISPINWCDGRNRGLPCPAPAGALVPWDRATDERALPQPRAGAAYFNVSANLYLVGGRTSEGATASVLGAILEEDDLGAWSEVAALPAPRADAVAVVSGGAPYVIGGLDAGGNPTATVYRGAIEEGALTGWEEVAELELPVAVSDASAIASARGIYVFGGTVDGQPSETVFLSAFASPDDQTLEPWTEVTELPLPEPRAGATAVLEGNFVYVLGGAGPDGVSDSVFFLALDADGVPVIDQQSGTTRGWGVSAGQAAAYALPEPRANHMSFVNSGAIYVIGGEGADGTLQRSTFWAEPEVEDGTLPLWRQLNETSLPAARADAGIIALGSFVYLIGGEAPDGPTADLYQANLAPSLPFFRLGLFGMTVPGLAIPGEVGQQLGYLAAAGAGTGTFILLVVIGFAFSHPRGTLRFFERVSRGRFRAPREEDEA